MSDSNGLPGNHAVAAAGSSAYSHALLCDDWNTEKSVFTVNDKPTMTYPKATAKRVKQWTFDQPF